MLKFIRWFVGKILLALNAIFAPKGLKRSPEDQAQYDLLTSKMALYEFEACPFCIKVRREMKRLSLTIERRDVLKNEKWEQELIDQGGKRKVPCLKILQEDGSSQWMYESQTIIDYLSNL